jgi:hypothetical protein
MKRIAPLRGLEWTITLKFPIVRHKFPSACFCQRCIKIVPPESRALGLHDFLPSFTVSDGSLAEKPLTVSSYQGSLV